MPDRRLKYEKNLDRLTCGELLWLDRLRRGETQERAANRRRISRNQQWREELDQLRCSRAPDLWPGTDEQLLLARRRLQLKLTDLVAEFNVSRVTLLKWQKKASPKLILYYRKRWGFTFDRSGRR